MIEFMTKLTYAISWRENDEQVFVGKLSFGLTHVRLEGRATDRHEVLRVLHYGDLGGIKAEHPNGHREIVLSCSGRGIAITVIDGAGAFPELLDELRRHAEKPHA